MATCIWSAAEATPRNDGAAELRLRDEFLVGVRLEALDAALVAVAAVLDAAERRFRGRDRHAVHPTMPDSSASPIAVAVWVELVNA